MGLFVMKLLSLREMTAMLAMLLVGAAIAGSPLFGDGWFNSHDIYAHNYRIYATLQEMRGGDFYPRWLSLALHGKGLPDLNFYSPAFYLWIAGLRLLGTPLGLALKGTCLALFFLGGLGTYIWVRNHAGKSGGIVAATLYLFVPYHFLDLYVRGALPEFAALALLPWLFFAIDLSFSPAVAARGIAMTAGVSAMLVLTHHLSAIIIAPFVVLYYSWKTLVEKRDPHILWLSVLGPAGGIGLSAFYWLPVVMELRYLKYFDDPLSVFDHFVNPSQWFDLAWKFGGSIPGQDDEISFQIGLVLSCAIAVGVAMIPFTEKHLRRFGLFILSLGLFGLLLTSSYTVLLYKLAYPLQLVQFPWRFIGPATLFLAAFCGMIIANRLLNRPWCRYMVLCLVFTASIIFSMDQRSVTSRFNIDVDKSMEKYISLGGDHFASEFLPKWATFDPDQKLESIPLIVGGHGTIAELTVGNAVMSFVLTAEQPTYVIIPWFYFPGWALTVDDRPATIQVDQTGFVAFSTPAGVYRIQLRFGTTWPRIIGWMTAAVTSLALAALLFKNGKISERKHRHRGDPYAGV